MPQDDDLLRTVEQFFSKKVTAHGANYKGVDYGNPERQVICFNQLTKILPDPPQSFSLIDYGCGYGALVEYLNQRGFGFTYTGFDLSTTMIEEARHLHGQHNNCTFVTDFQTLVPADFAIAGAIFNVRLEISDEAWKQIILDTLTKMWALSTQAMAFNILTSYSDPDRMRPDLYYADPCFMFDYCKRHFSKDVALLHDYGLYEFTVLVRRSV